MISVSSNQPFKYLVIIFSCPGISVFCAPSKSGFFIVFFTLLLASSTFILSNDPADAARHYTRPVEFDFVSWTLNALDVKLGQAALDTPFYFNGSARHKIVVDYLHLIDNILQDENKLELIYTDPSVQDPAAASASLRAELAGLYTRQRQVAPMAEAVLQEQVSSATWRTWALPPEANPSRQYCSISLPCPITWSSRHAGKSRRMLPSPLFPT